MAQDALADIWMRSTDRSEVSIASNKADRLLREAPATHGEELNEGLWKLRCPPLTILYAMAIVDLLVRVAYVRIDT